VFRRGLSEALTLFGLHSYSATLRHAAHSEPPCQKQSRTVFCLFGLADRQTEVVLLHPDSQNDECRSTDCSSPNATSPHRPLRANTIPALTSNETKLLRSTTRLFHDAHTTFIAILPSRTIPPLRRSLTTDHPQFARLAVTVCSLVRVHNVWPQTTKCVNIHHV
jgi:hypothetical protein